MLAKQILLGLAVSASFLGSVSARGTGNNGGNKGGNNNGANNGGNNGGNNNGGNVLALNPNLVQKGSQQTGGNTDGETPSATSVNHLISYF